MGLTCSCDHEPEPGETLYYGPSDYAPLSTKRRRRCLSCDAVIAVGDLCCKVPRIKVPAHDIEVSIYGEDGEIPLAPKYLCERCSDIAHSLEALGFCPNPWEDQRELLADYVETYGNKAP